MGRLHAAPLDALQRRLRHATGISIAICARGLVFPIPTRRLSALPLARRPRQAAFLLSFAMDDHHILILSILVGMAAAGIVFGTFLVHAHG
jgi:hypothetical protein